MTDHIISPDGKSMWTGSEWIPLPPNEGDEATTSKRKIKGPPKSNRSNKLQSNKREYFVQNFYELADGKSVPQHNRMELFFGLIILTIIVSIIAWFWWMGGTDSDSQYYEDDLAFATHLQVFVWCGGFISICIILLNKVRIMWYQCPACNYRYNSIEERNSVIKYEVISVTSSTKAIKSWNPGTGIGIGADGKASFMSGGMTSTSHIPIQIGKVKTTTVCSNCHTNVISNYESEIKTWTNPENVLSYEVAYNGLPPLPRKNIYSSPEYIPLVDGID